jgi:molecular chaperone GrpE
VSASHKSPRSEDDNPDRRIPPEGGDHPSAPESMENLEEANAALEERVAKLQAELEDLRATLIRRQADFENFRKRVERDRHDESRRVAGHLIQHILPVLDTFEHALAAHDDPAYAEYRRGFELIYKQLWETLAKQGLERINAEGQTFDPHYHEAIARVETGDHAEGAVIEVLRPGYIYHGRVLRPATVRVAAAPTAASNKDN